MRSRNISWPPPPVKCPCPSIYEPRSSRLMTSVMIVSVIQPVIKSLTVSLWSAAVTWPGILCASPRRGSRYDPATPGNKIKRIPVDSNVSLELLVRVWTYKTLGVITAACWTGNSHFITAHVPQAGNVHVNVSLYMWNETFCQKSQFQKTYVIAAFTVLFRQMGVGWVGVEVGVGLYSTRKHSPDALWESDGRETVCLWLRDFHSMSSSSSFIWSPDNFTEH